MRPGSDTTRFADDERAISTQIAYVLSVAVTAVLITTLITSVTGFVADKQDTAIRYEMTGAGERLATQIQDVDAVAHESGARRVALAADVPATVGGKQYTITLSDSCEVNAGGQHPCLVLESTNDIVMRFPLRIDTAVDDGAAVSGGDFAIVYEASDDHITLEER